MNLVKLIMDQFSDEALGRLGGLLGTDRDTASRAASAAVPSLLSALSGTASRSDGARKLTDVLRGFDADDAGSLAQSLSGDTGPLVQRGTSLLDSLFGGNIVNAIANAISRFSGLGSGTVKTLLASLLPTVLGKVASQWKREGGTASALTSLFANQKRNIADALPTGLSLADIPGLSEAGAAVRDGAHAAQATARRAVGAAEPTAKSMAAWLVPLALVLIGGFLLWNYLGRQPADDVAVQRDDDGNRTTTMRPVTGDDQGATDRLPQPPDVTRVTSDMQGVLTSFTDQLGSIEDAATAEAALPQLQDIKTKLDGLSATWEKLPESGRSTLRPVVDEQLEKIKLQAERTASLPGLGERVKSLIQEIVRILTRFVTPAAER